MIVICGPTASGKTGLSLVLADRFDGEIISADSMQVYKNLDIGTAKATKEEQSKAKHHLVDFLNPDEPYNVELFTRLAKEKIEDISGRGKLPIIAGGTGLYIESLVNGISFTDQPTDKTVRAGLEKQLEEHGKEYMYQQLVDIDPEYAAGVHQNNAVRVIRALEIYYTTGVTMTQQIAASKPKEKPYDVLFLATGFKDRSKLYENIEKRVDIMVDLGVLAEAEYVFKNKETFVNSAAAIGYKEFFPYFYGTQSLQQCIDELKKASRHYAKRQLTWFNRMENINWLYVDGEEDYKQTALTLTESFLNK
ncbi:MAG: tRNA (adenosine(37)-N6)-dimethylallyltransferase MiaA [Oscillospiraceae bacterium]|nr:tRNA (adenosine(37)-N6)-dimethylallyltransferase MiaA [Oscillospiraceae bacterium]